MKKEVISTFYVCWRSPGTLWPTNINYWRSVQDWAKGVDMVGRSPMPLNIFYTIKFLHSRVLCSNKIEFRHNFGLFCLRYASPNVVATINTVKSPRRTSEFWHGNLYWPKKMKKNKNNLLKNKQKNVLGQIKFGIPKRKCLLDGTLFHPIRS